MDPSHYVQEIQEPVPQSDSMEDVKTDVIKLEEEKESELGFKTLGLSNDISDALKLLFNIHTPTPIQTKVIPELLWKTNVIKNKEWDRNKFKVANKRDKVQLSVFGDQTGTGKTLAYLLPIIDAIKKDEVNENILLRVGRPRCVIIAPTIELCHQIRSVIKELGSIVGVSSCLFTPGESMLKQKKRFKNGVDIVVGTPKRIKEMLVMGEKNSGWNSDAFYLSDCRYIILDEIDVLLNEGFMDDELRYILTKCCAIKSDHGINLDKLTVGSKGTPPKNNIFGKYYKKNFIKRHVIGCSATISKKDIDKLCFELNIEPKGIQLIRGDALHCVLPNMNLYFWDSRKQDKLLSLRLVLRQDQIEYNQNLDKIFLDTNNENVLKNKYLKKSDENKVPNQTIIFCRTKKSASAVGYYLEKYNFKHSMLFGVHSPVKRDESYTKFINGEASILVASDLAMRGLDISNVKHVILFDFPHNTKAFLHRIGRTNRINTIDKHNHKVTALINKRDYFIAAAILTALNEGTEITNINNYKPKYRVVPHLMLRTAASNVTIVNKEHKGSHINKLKPFEHMAVKLLTFDEKAKLKHEERMERNMSRRKLKLYKKKKHKLKHPRLWFYYGGSHTRVPFFGIKKRILKRLVKMQSENDRKKLLAAYTTRWDEMRDPKYIIRKRKKLRVYYDYPTKPQITSNENTDYPLHKQMMRDKYGLK